jgi:MerR family transcriptional regulator, thiopeptide resistance regulator
VSDTLERHIGQVDQRLAALGRHRERMISVRDSLAAGNPTDEELLDILHEMVEIDHGLTQRLTLLVYSDIEAVHDHLVAAFGFGPGTISRDESGRVVHGELHVGDGVIWMHPPSAEYGLASPASLGASTHCKAVMVDDVGATTTGRSPRAPRLPIRRATWTTGFVNTARATSRAACGRS